MTVTTNKCIIVDDLDNIIGTELRDKLTTSMRWRNTCVYLYNSKNEILIAKRHPSKREHPNLWGPSASGTVEEGESYQSNAYTEVLEEIGILVKGLKFHGSYYIDHGSAKRFTGLFTGFWDGSIEEIILEKNEVAAVKFIAIDELIEDLYKNPTKYVPGLNKTLNASGIKTNRPVEFKLIYEDEKRKVYR